MPKKWCLNQVVHLPSGACLLCYLWPKWFKVPAREWESRNSPSCACARGSPRFSCLEAVFLGGERNFCNIHFSSLFCLRRGNGFPLSLSGRFSRPPKSINKDRVWKEGRARGPGSRADRGSRYQNNEEGMRILGETGSYLIQF